DGVCAVVSDSSPCDDGDACTQTDLCAAGECVGGNPVTCTALDECHVAGTCNGATGKCSNPSQSDGTACNDGDPCTQTDTCQGGACTGKSPIVCTALDACHQAGICDKTTGICSAPLQADGKACDDGDACTPTDSCQGGVCKGANPVVCVAQDQ